MLVSSGEIAEIGRFSPDDLPEPTTNLLKHAIADARNHARGAVRLISLD